MESHVTSTARLIVSRKAESRCAAITISTPSVTTSPDSFPLASAAMHATAASRPTASTRQPSTWNDGASDVILSASKAYGRYGAMSGSSVALSDSGIGPIGERHGPTSKPYAPIAHFTGIGLDVMNSAAMSGERS